ncbi:MAG: ParA family protein [Chloroflexota bacterium]
MPYVISICHQKGGVAKTTTALALGACFVEQRHQTLVIDLDPQANLTTAVGLHPAAMRHSAADVLLGNETLLRVSRETKLPGLDVVPSNPDMLVVSKALYLRSQFEYLLREGLLSKELAFYDFVVIDCPPALGPITISALTASDLVIIPTQCEYFSVQALDGIFQMIRLVRSRTNPRLIYRMLVTMFDQRGHLHSRVLAHMQQRFSDSMLQTVIGVDSKLRESQLVGKPITVHAPHGRGTQQYRQLTQEVLQYVQQRQQLPATA